MRRGIRRIALVSGLGAAAGAVAAWIAYMVREPETLGGGAPGLSITVDEITLSNEAWAIVGLTLLGALVCGVISASYVWHKGFQRTVLAVLIAAPLGAFLCWGARWLMDQLIYAKYGGPEARIDPLELGMGSQVPWFVWQAGVGFALSLPVVLAIGPTWFTFLRGLIGSGLVIVFGYTIGTAIGALLLLMLLPLAMTGGLKNADPNAIARFADVVYLFTLGAAAGLAFAFAEVLYKPAWLKSYGGTTEGRVWTIGGELSRIGCQEGVEVFVPPDGRTAPIHAQIQTTEDGHWLSDLCGGTLLNGAPVQGAWLSDGDRIGAGSHQLVFRTRLAPTGRPAPQRTQEPAPVAAHPAPAGAPFVPVASASAGLPAVSGIWKLKDPMGHAFEIRPGNCTIGRDASCDLALTWEASVSRRHAEVAVGAGHLSVRDLGSTNGTFVNEQRVAGPTPLKPGDALRLGSCRMKVERDP